MKIKKREFLVACLAAIGIQILFGILLIKYDGSVLVEAHCPHPVVEVCKRVVDVPFCIPFIFAGMVAFYTVLLGYFLSAGYKRYYLDPNRLTRLRKDALPLCAGFLLLSALTAAIVFRNSIPDTPWKKDRFRTITALGADEVKKILYYETGGWNDHQVYFLRFTYSDDHWLESYLGNFQLPLYGKMQRVPLRAVTDTGTFSELISRSVSNPPRAWWRPISDKEVAECYTWGEDIFQYAVVWVDRQHKRVFVFFSRE